LLGHGDGTFAPHRRFDATSKPWSLDTGDLNGDGNPDIVAIDDFLDRKLSLAILLGRGDGTFRREILLETESPGSAGVSKVQIADVNGDGHADILYAGNEDQNTHILLGRGDGTFDKGQTVDGGAPGLVLVDLDRDGDVDAVSASIYNNTISFSLGNGDGTFSAATTFFGGQS